MANRSQFSILLIIFLLLSIITGIVPARASSAQQEDDPEIQARELLEQMTPEDRVGQLFLISFSGSTVTTSSPVYDLVTEHHIGGVILSAENDNFVDSPNTVSSAHLLITDLQTAVWTYKTQASENGGEIQGSYSPLFVGISQDGDGFPGDQILKGMTELPSLMSIGATWDPELAHQIGAVAGKELSAIGFNLFLGPSLDVIEGPNSTSPSIGGSNFFGGDPYWVGQMGEAYISGVHEGSTGRIAVIAKNFPGRGSADRQSGDEVATVRKSLEQLKQIELAPFFSVTENPPASSGRVDGLLVSHIRYQGFQGNIRATTRPVSFDSQALTQILTVSPFLEWRFDGGVIVSDDLSSDTVRKFYDPGGTGFSARLVVRDAFLAGNDLIYLGEITSSGQPDSYSTIIEIVDYFAQKYREDSAFAQRVDESALRILTMKYRLYGDFHLSSVIPPVSGLIQLDRSNNITFDVARRSATLINPDASELASILPAPPGERDRIVFLTDALEQKQCSACIPYPAMQVDAMQSIVLRLYGPQGGGQVNPNRISSYTTNSLETILQAGIGNEDLSRDLDLANWVVISLLNWETNESENILRKFLAQRQDLLREKNVIVFTFNAPQYLDATDISKFTAYYGLYSKSEPFIEVAARILFQELSPAGDLPVSVPGIGYDLLSATAPDPDQVIEIAIDLTSGINENLNTESTPPAPPIVRVGDTINLRTGVILDHNGNPVPDGTGTRFLISTSGDGTIIQQLDGSTIDGVARASFTLDRSGLLEIRATSEPAKNSVVLQIEITSEGLNITALPPPVIPGTDTPTPAFEILAPLEKEIIKTETTSFFDWIVMFIALATIGALVFWLTLKKFSIRWSVRFVLCALVGGVIAYSYLAFDFPGTARFIQKNGTWGSLWVTIGGMLLGYACAFIWHQVQPSEHNQPS